MAKKITIFLVAVLIAGLGAFRIASAFKAHGHHRVNLNWQAPAEKPGVAVKSYNVYRSTTSGGQYAKIASGPEPRYSDTNSEQRQNLLLRCDQRRCCRPRKRILCGDQSDSTLRVPAPS